MKRRDLPLPNQVLAYTDFADNSYENAHLVVPKAKDANLITSMVPDSAAHKLIIDIDLPAALLPSSTPGHFHLFIDKEMDWDVYLGLLRALERAGIIEPGYLNAAERRMHTAVRLPWIHKGETNGN